ncbi:MAG: diaminopropionate ammonia-lyase [Pseudomonadota bacterium]
MDGFPPGAMAHSAGNPVGGDAVQSVLTPQDFATAWDEITGWPGYAPTPLVALPALAKRIGVGSIHYKDEGLRFGLGSFKALGGAYAAARLLQRQIEAHSGTHVALAEIGAGAHAKACANVTLVSATDGNHGRSLAWGCQRFGAPCRIYIHAEVSEGRAEAMRAFGAEVVRIEGDYDASVALARDEAAAQGWFVVSDTSWPGYSEPPRDVMAGYGVMAREVCAALDPAPTHVLLQGGVGGFAAAVTAAFRQHWAGEGPRILVVEPELAPCLFASAKAGAPTTVSIEHETIMAGLSCGEPSPLAWPILAAEVSDFLTIPDSLVPPAMRLLARPLEGDPPIEGGECSAAGLAALIAAIGDGERAALLGLDARSRVLLFGTEGITDPEIYAKLVGDVGDVGA